MTERYQFEKHIRVIATKSDAIIPRNKVWIFTRIKAWSKWISGENCNMTKLQKSADGGKCDMLKTGPFEILCVVKYDFGHSI